MSKPEAITPGPDPYSERYVNRDGESSGSTAKRFWSGKLLYRLFVGSSILGIILPVTTIILLLAADNYRNWDERIAKGSWQAKLVEDYPILDLRRFPVLESLSWHSSREGPWRVPPSYRIWDYVGLAIANTVILLAILGFRRHLRVLCSRWISWLHLPNHRGPRRLIFAASIWLILSFQLRLLCGFYFPGIHGWHYSNLMSGITQELPDGIVLGESVDEPFLAGGILPENARYLPKTGYLTSGVMFLHFRGGEVLPGNYELTELVFPQYIFGQLYEEIIEPELFFDVVRRSIDRRRQNRKFLLPLSIAYPNHMPYGPLPHDQFPPGAELEAVSLWDLTIHVNAERQVEVVAAHEKNRIYDR